MPYRTAATECRVHLIALRHLPASTRAQCAALRQEAERLWMDLVGLHAQARLAGQWLSAQDLEQATKGGQYALGSQTVQALCQKLAANIATATELRKQELTETGRLQTEYPHHAKTYQTVIWKDQGVVWDQPRCIGLKNGLGRPYLYLPLPAHHLGANVRKAELLWRADHYELALTLDTGQTLPVTRPVGEIAGIDLGEVHVAAITTTRRHALVLSGRQLRAFKQWRNKSHARLSEKLARCQAGSRRSRRLLEAKARVSAKTYRQQRDFLHKAARVAVDFCVAEGVGQIVVGDVRDIQTGVSLGKVTNQKISQWPHGQFFRYLSEKAARQELAVEWIDEAYSTKTCSHDGYVHKDSPRGRRFRCVGCGARLHRDVNGANNICSKGVHGVYAKVQADTVKYLRPIGVAPPTRANVASAS
jgi:putative transposase